MAHFSYTQMDTYIKCPEKYRFRYIEKIRMPAGAELLRGDAYHKGVAYGYSGVIAYHKYPSLDEVLQVYSDAWNKRAKEQIINEDDAELTVPAITFGDKKPGEMKDEGAVVLTKYYNEVLTKTIPDRVEKRFTTVYHGISLLSYVDLIQWDGTVVDHKTGKKSYSDDEIEREMQSSFYAISMGFNQIKHFEIHQAVIKKNPEIKIIPISRTPDDIEWVGKLIDKSWDTIQRGSFCPSPTGWWCSKSFCEYWGFCKMPSSF